MNERICRRCDVAWKSDDGLCWVCREPGELALIANLSRPCWSRGAHFINWQPYSLPTGPTGEVVEWA